jgi:thioredoxin reductase (NADPH)
VIVVGGGNSVGQAAVLLSQSAKRVHVLIRSAGLVEIMSRYLINRIKEKSEIVLHPRTEISNLEGDYHLELVFWQNNQSGQVEAYYITCLL